MTFAEFSANKSARQKLQQLLNDPVMSAVLDMLRDANLPKVIMQHQGVTDMDPIQSIAIAATHRAGFQHALSLLKALPTIEPTSARQDTLPAWQWTAPPEEAQKPKRSRK